MGMVSREDSEKWSKRLRGLNQQRVSNTLSDSQKGHWPSGALFQPESERESWHLRPRRARGKSLASAWGVEVWRTAMENRNFRACELATMMR